MDFNKGLDDLKDKGQQHFDDNKDESIDKGKELVTERFDDDNAEAGKNMEAGPGRDDTSSDER